MTWLPHDEACESATNSNAMHSHCRCAQRYAAREYIPLPTPNCPFAGSEPCTSGCVNKWRACVDND